MQNIPDPVRRRLETQGFKDLPDSVLRQVDVGARVGPAVCAIWLGAGLVLGVAPLVAALVPVALAGAVTRRHPVDLVRECMAPDRAEAISLPPHPGPRRFAFLVVALLFGITALLLATNSILPGRVVGVVTLAMLVLHVVTGHCLSARLYARIFGPPPGYRV
jgi:hypothetical protein